MTLEEKLRALAAKGELVHFSVACKDGIFWANYAPASTSGYARESDADPVVALERALAAAPVKIRAPKARPEKRSDEVSANQEPEPAPEITAAVTASDEIVDTGFPNDWTTP